MYILQKYDRCSALTNVTEEKNELLMENPENNF